MFWCTFFNIWETFDDLTFQIIVCTFLYRNVYREVSVYAWILMIFNQNGNVEFELVTCAEIPLWNVRTRWFLLSNDVMFKVCAVKEYSTNDIWHHVIMWLETCSFPQCSWGLYLLENECITKLKMTLEPFFKDSGHYW